MTDKPLFEHALDLSRRGQNKSAGRILTRLAEAGNAEAAACVGELFCFGYLKSKDPLQSAEAWYRRAAEGGSLRGAFEYARALDNPDKGDPEAAKRWYEAAFKGLEEAAGRGDTDGRFLLSKMYMYGIGVTQDESRGVALLESAAASGHLEAKLHLGHWYWELPGRSEEQRQAAVRLWREAAEGGDMAAQYHLGVCYATEPDMPVDFADSVRFYRMAADKGNLEALYNLGTMYLEGEGVPKDVPYGHGLIVNAGEAGDIGALHYLREAYAHGYHGLPVDEAEASYWRKKCED